MSKKIILDAIKLHYKFKSNTEYATFLGIAPQTLSSWYSRNTLDYDLVYSKCVDIDANWLLTGEGPMLKNEIRSDALPLASDPQVLYGRQNDEIKNLREQVKEYKKELENKQKIIDSQLKTIDEQNEQIRAYRTGRIVNTDGADTRAPKRGAG